MEMEANQVLNQINFKFFTKMIETKNFKTPKNQAQNQIRGNIKFIIIKKHSNQNGNQEPNNISLGNQPNLQLWILRRTTRSIA
jgi:hypothetical protein